MNKSTRQCPPWDLLPDDIWAHIIGYLRFRDKLGVQRACRRYHRLLTNPFSKSIWGRLHLLDDGTADVGRLRSWVQQRIKGISAVWYSQEAGGDGLCDFPNSTPTLWHALVASTAGTHVRLRLRSNTVAAARLVSLPYRTELTQRLTALDISIYDAEDIRVVHSLVALRHLRLKGCDGEDVPPRAADGGSARQEFQLSALRTLQLFDVHPRTILIPGSAARLQHLHSVQVQECWMSGGVLPAELLRLQSLSRLVLVQIPQLHMMPDLRQLPALHRLLISVWSGGPYLGASPHPLGGAVGLTQLVLHSIGLAGTELVTAIEQLPHLKVLGLDCGIAEQVNGWADILWERMHGRCSVQPASDFISLEAQTFVVHDKWPNDDW